MSANDNNQNATTSRNGLRLRSFGSRGEHNHIHLRSLFPEMSVQEALDFLSMVVEDPRDPNMSDDAMNDAIEQASNTQLLHFCDGDGEQAEKWLEKSGGDSYQAYKMARECVETRIEWIRTYREVTGVGVAEAEVEGERWGWKRVQRAISEFFATEEEGAEEELEEGELGEGSMDLESSEDDEE